jgi:hypothetical protein
MVLPVAEVLPSTVRIILEWDDMRNGRHTRGWVRVGVAIGVALLAVPGGAVMITANAADSSVATSNVTEEQAKTIALKALPGKVNKVELEMKEGKKTYVVEIITEKTEQKKDVWVDYYNGKLRGVGK